MMLTHWYIVNVPIVVLHFEFYIVFDRINAAVLCFVAQQCPTLCDPMDCSPPGTSVLGASPGKNTWVGSHSLLQRNFPTQEVNWGLLHCRQILYRLSYQRSPSISICGIKLAIKLNTEILTNSSSQKFHQKIFRNVLSIYSYKCSVTKYILKGMNKNRITSL